MKSCLLFNSWVFCAFAIYGAVDAMEPQRRLARPQNTGNTKKPGTSRCPKDCGKVAEFKLCGSDDVTYDNGCELAKAKCSDEEKEDLLLKYPGKCIPSTLGPQEFNQTDDVDVGDVSASDEIYDVDVDCFNEYLISLEKPFMTHSVICNMEASWIDNDDVYEDREISADSRSSSRNGSSIDSDKGSTADVEVGDIDEESNNSITIPKNDSCMESHSEMSSDTVGCHD